MSCGQQLLLPASCACLCGIRFPLMAVLSEYNPAITYGVSKVSQAISVGSRKLACLTAAISVTLKVPHPNSWGVISSTVWSQPRLQGKGIEKMLRKWESCDSKRGEPPKIPCCESCGRYLLVVWCESMLLSLCRILPHVLPHAAVPVRDDPYGSSYLDFQDFCTNFEELLERNGKCDHKEACLGRFPI